MAYIAPNKVCSTCTECTNCGWSSIHPTMIIDTKYLTHGKCDNWCEPTDYRKIADRVDLNALCNLWEAVAAQGIADATGERARIFVAKKGGYA